MCWIDIALLMLSCVLANHMGLISAVEKLIGHDLPVLNCVKCSTFWFVLLLCLINKFGIIASCAISFLASYVAIWLELLFGIVDKCYEKVYNKTYKDTADATTESSYYSDPTRTEG